MTGKDRNNTMEVLVYPDVFSESPSGLWRLDREITAPVFAFVRSGSWSTHLKALRDNSLRDPFRCRHSLKGFTTAVLFALMRAIALFVPSMASDSKKDYLDRIFGLLLDAGPGTEKGLLPFSELPAHTEVTVCALNAVSALIDRRYRTVSAVEGAGVTEEQLQELLEAELDVTVESAADRLMNGAAAAAIDYGDSGIIDRTSIETYLEPGSAVPVLDAVRLSVCTAVNSDDTGGNKRNAAMFLLSASFLEMLSLTLPEGEATPGTLTELLGGGCSECGRCMTSFDSLRMLGTNSAGPFAADGGVSTPVYAESMTGCGIPEYLNDTFLPLFCAVYCCGGPVSTTVITRSDGFMADTEKESYEGRDARPQDDGITPAVSEDAEYIQALEDDSHRKYTMEDDYEEDQGDNIPADDQENTDGTEGVRYTEDGRETGEVAGEHIYGRYDGGSYSGNTHNNGDTGDAVGSIPAGDPDPASDGHGRTDTQHTQVSERQKLTAKPSSKKPSRSSFSRIPSDARAAIPGDDTYGDARDTAQDGGAEEPGRRQAPWREALPNDAAEAEEQHAGGRLSVSDFWDAEDEAGTKDIYYPK